MLDTVLISKEYFKITFHGHNAPIGIATGSESINKIVANPRELISQKTKEKK